MHTTENIEVETFKSIFFNIENIIILFVYCKREGHMSLYL